MRSKRALQFGAGAVLLSVATGSPPMARAQQTAPPSPTFRVTSNLVFLDVTVLDKKGQPVTTGLTKDDFALTEDGKPQRIFSFDPPPAGAKTAENPPATIFVLDLLNTPSEDFAYARDSISRYLALQPARISPTELMVLNNTSLDMVQAYTHSRGDLTYALEHIPRELPYKLSGGKDWLDQRLSQSIEALQQIALQNRDLPGRKNILWVGNGGPGIPIDPADPRYEKSMRFFAHGTTNMLVDARISLFVINPGGVQGVQNPEYWRIATSSPVLGATIDIPGDPFEGSINFGMLVRDTGGVFFHNRNDVDAEIGEAQELGSNYYTITYQPPVGVADGEFRQIAVTLHDPNLRAMTKTGYYAPEPGNETNPEPQRVDPMVEISEAAQSNVAFDSLGLTIAQVTRHPNNSTAELTVLLKSTHLRWQATDDGRSAANITVAAVSLSKRRDILASRLQRLTIFSNNQDPARLAGSNTFVTVTVPAPRHTESVRVVILAQDGGQIGTAELDHKSLSAAPESPTPEPQLQNRPRPVAIAPQQP